MTSTDTITTTTGLDASPERVSFLEEFFDKINDEAASTYTYATAYINGELAGVVATSRPDDASYVKIAFLRIADEHRREGVATALIDAVREEADRDELLAKVHVAWYGANQFYRENGWRLDDERCSGMLNAYVLD